MARIAMLLTNGFTRDARVEREARTLAEAGHELTVFALAGEGLPESEERDGYAVRRLRLPAWHDFTGPRRLVPLLRWYGRYAFMAEAAAATSPDVIHGHDLETLLPAATTAHDLGIPHVHDDHELGLEKLGQGTAEWLTGPRRFAMDRITGHLRRRGARLERRWIPRAAALVTACPLYGQVLEERYGKKPVVLHNMPWNSDLPPNPDLHVKAGLDPSTRIVLYQGTITPSGGAEECIEAAGQLPEGWALVFLGVTWMKSRLEGLARKAGLAEKVRFIDPVLPAVLPGYTLSADIGLAPIRPTNRGQAYSLANKIFEYLHAGLPIVASDLPGQGPLVRELDAGVVLEEISPACIAEAIGRLAVATDEERETRADRLRTTARERLCWNVEQEKLKALYSELLGDS
ncbi:MAG: glycosyltransferase family 4 protein [Planctomycetota bacterium]|jgi:glycosyltransferase involved in cell wall biosynthesis